MHVLIIPSWYPKSAGDFGGSFFREQAIGLADHGLNVHVAMPALRSLRCLFDPSAKRGLTKVSDNNVSTLLSHGVSWFPGNVRATSRLWHLHERRLFGEYEREFGRADVIHAHSLLALPTAYRLAQRWNVPLVLTEHSSACLSTKSLARWDERWYRKALEYGAYAIGVSGALCEAMEAHIPGFKWHIVPNIVHQRFFDEPILSDQSLNSFHVVSTGTLKRIKRYDILIRAFALAFANDIKCQLTIIGDGIERKPLEDLARRLGICSQVTFLGALPRDQISRHVVGKSVFALSSDTETFGVVLAEALALGVPIVSTRCGGPNDIVNKANGILVPTNDVESMAEALKTIRNRSEDYPPQKLRADCQARFSPQGVSARVFKAYSQITASFHSRPKI